MEVPYCDLAEGETSRDGDRTLSAILGASITELARMPIIIIAIQAPAVCPVLRADAASVNQPR
jgi:hypothetical protein